MDVAQAFQGSTKKHDIPLGNLDFSYIKECSDVKELEKMLRVLRSKEEGFYPDLEKCCEERLKDLNPNSRLLRKDTPLFSKGDLASQEKEELEKDLRTWTSDMKNIESNIGSDSGVFDDMDNEELPPIRSGNIVLTAEGAKSSKPQKTNPTKKPLPREYRDWDKIDVEKELQKIDEGDGKGKERTFIANREVTNIPDKIDAKGLTESEKLMKANREKDKGNEAFRSNDYKEAVTYYTRSISLQPTAASYNNRALAYLKLSEWQKAISDTNTVLKVEPDNVKALLRRSTAYKGLKQLQKARLDIENVFKLEPNNRKAQELLEQIEKDRQEKKKKGRRMVIEDVDGDDETESHAMTAQDDSSSKDSSKREKKQKEDKSVDKRGEKSSKKSSRRMEIVEVESESEEEIGNENNNPVVVNGHDSNVGNKRVAFTESKNVEKVLNEESEEEKLSETTDDRSENEEIVLERNSPVQVISESPTDEENETDTNVGDRDSLVEADENISDTDSVEEKEISEVESSETETVEPLEDFKRPVFYMKELPRKAAAVKEEATALFRSGQYGEASQKYNKLINMLENDESQVVNLSLMYSNRAACHLKTGDLSGTVKDCNASLHLIPHSVKPLLRRAIAYEHLERYRPAYIDYRHVLLLDSRMEQAHQGTKRCQHMLSQKDGPRWRDKVHLPKVSPYQIPDIIGLDGKSTTPIVFSNSPATSQSQSTCSSSSQESISQGSPSPTRKMEKMSQVDIEDKTNENEEDEDSSESKLSPQELFDAFKSEGNELVKQSKFKEAIEWYNKCDAVLPGQVAIHTNRALCYIRTNQAKNAEEDCSKALTIEKDNVKALFRRAQARKMLQQYREGIEDIKHLLQVDPKNSAAKKEMEILKNYWREQLENMKKDLDTLKNKKDDLSSQTSCKTGTQSSHKTDTQSSNKSDTQSSHKSDTQSSHKSDTQSSKKSGTQSNKKSGSQSAKQRKRMVIEEVESEEEDKPKDAPKATGNGAVPKVEIIDTEENKQKPDTKPVKVVKQSSQTGSNKTDSKPRQKKTTIKETSQGLPSVPKSAPKLDKATPYEFISAWNALKKSETVKPYYDVLKQIKPGDIKTVISNKLDGAMLNVIIRCVAEHYLPNGEGDTCYELLKNLSAVPRFGTVAMFMSQKEKSEVLAVMNRLEFLPTRLYNQTDISKLRKLYIV